MKTRLILLGFAFSTLPIFCISAVHAQTGQCMEMGMMTTCTDSRGTNSTRLDLGGGMQSYSDSRGNSGNIMDFGNGLGTFNFSGPSGPTSGQFQQFGPMGQWQDNRGNQGQWQDLGGGLSSYQTQPNRRNGR